MRGTDNILDAYMQTYGYTYTLLYTPPPEPIFHIDLGELVVKSRPVRKIKSNHTVTSKPRFRHMTMRRGN